MTDPVSRRGALERLAQLALAGGTVATSIACGGGNAGKASDPAEAQGATVDAKVGDDDVGLDASAPDTNAPDTSAPDTNAPDTSTSDASTPDASTPDAGTPDTSAPDASTPDTSAPDTNTSDAGTPDAAAPDATTPDSTPADTCSTAPGVAPDDQPPAPCLTTGDDTEGPFYESGAPAKTTLAPKSEPGERLLITGRVFNHTCAAALAGVTIDLWHADAKGAYRDLSHAVPLRGVLTTDCDGKFAFETILPGAYLDSGGYRPRHIHCKITPAGGATLTTQLYFAGDPYLAPNDSCSSCKSGDATHIIALKTTAVAGVKQHVGVFKVVV